MIKILGTSSFCELETKKNERGSRLGGSCKASEPRLASNRRSSRMRISSLFSLGMEAEHVGLSDIEGQDENVLLIICSTKQYGQNYTNTFKNCNAYNRRRVHGYIKNLEANINYARKWPQNDRHSTGKLFKAQIKKHDCPSKLSVTTRIGVHGTNEVLHELITDYMGRAGYGAMDLTLFTRKARNDFLLVQIYVDDIIFTSTNTAMCNEFANLMTTKFKTLIILGVVITQEVLSSKFLRSFPPEWNTHVVVWMNKADIKTMSIDNLYNNFKIFEEDVKKSVGISTGAQNMAFMIALSTSSTNDVNTPNPAYEASTVSPNVNIASPQVNTANFSDNAVYAFMVENPNGSNLLQ
nr:hypothetical protein [Tanacetum cinerariifolium]